MAEEVLATLYLDLHVDRPSFGSDDIKRVDAAFDERVQSGLPAPTLTAEAIEFAADGIAFVGEPSTPPRHWETLAGELSDEEARARKSLAVAAP